MLKQSSNTFKQFEYDITAIREDLRIIESIKQDNPSYYEDTRYTCPAHNLQHVQTVRIRHHSKEAFKRDSASCYEDKDVMQYMKTRGIHVQRTRPYTHHQGGLVARAHRTIS